MFSKFKNAAKFFLFTSKTVNCHFQHTRASKVCPSLSAYFARVAFSWILLLPLKKTNVNHWKNLGMQAVQMAKAGLKGIYLSGWQVAADANQAGQTFPDQSLYPADSAPKLVQRINNAFQRADQIQHMEGVGPQSLDYFLPIVADCEAGFGGPLNAFEIVKNMVGPWKSSNLPLNFCITLAWSQPRTQTLPQRKEPGYEVGAIPDRSPFQQSW